MWNRKHNAGKYVHTLRDGFKGLDPAKDEGEMELGFMIIIMIMIITMFIIIIILFFL